MTDSPYDAAQRLLSPGAKPWLEPTRCRDLAELFRELADRLERAAEPPAPWLGSTTTAR